MITSVFVLSFSLSLAVYATTWPSEISETLQIEMPSGYEPSGITWNTDTDKLFVVSDNGEMTQMNMDGSDQISVSVSGDNEAVTIVDPSSSIVYIGLENPDSIVEYDWDKEEKDKSWDLSSIMTGDDNSGLEGLTFVPNSYHSFRDSDYGGVFYAAIQRTPVLSDEDTNNDYLIYAFDINLDNSGEIIDWWGLDLPSGTPESDISDLYFSEHTGLLYVLFDSYDRLIEMDPETMEVVADYSDIPIPGDQQEGVVVVPTSDGVADIYFAYDKEVYSSGVVKYSGYEIPEDEEEEEEEITDEDGDGVAAELDCNDSDASVSEPQIYYKDRDGDGLGNPKRPKSFCSSTAPSKYVDNADDLKDWDFDNDGINKNRDCDDTDSSIGKKNKYFRDADGDGLGNKHVKVKACEQPEGFVDNRKDKDDDSYDV